MNYSEKTKLAIEVKIYEQKLLAESSSEEVILTEASLKALDTSNVPYQEIMNWKPFNVEDAASFVLSSDELMMGSPGLDVQQLATRLVGVQVAQRTPLSGVIGSAGAGVAGFFGAPPWVGTAVTFGVTALFVWSFTKILTSTVMKIKGLLNPVERLTQQIDKVTVARDKNIKKLEAIRQGKKSTTDEKFEKLIAEVDRQTETQKRLGNDLSKIVEKMEQESQTSLDRKEKEKIQHLKKTTAMLRKGRLSFIGAKR